MRKSTSYIASAVSILSLNIISNFISVIPQLGIGEVHFFITCSVARYNDLRNESSVGNTVLIFVNLRN